MANVRILAPNVVDLATLTTSPAANASYPVTNLQSPVRSREWRSTGLATQNIFGDIPSSSINGFAITRHNLSNAATYRLRIWNTIGQAGTLLYDSGTLTLGNVIGWGEFDYGFDPWGGGNIFTGWDYVQTSRWFTLVASARSFSLVLTDAGNPDGYMAISRMFLGDYFEPLKNMSYGLRLSWQEASQQFRASGGTLRTDGSIPYRRWSFRLEALSEAERADLFTIAEYLNLSEDMFLSCFPESEGAVERDYSGQVKFQRTPEFITDKQDNTVVDLVFEEA